jgi:GT2 family glycosyltransferase
MRRAGINSVRVHCAPPPIWFLEAIEEHDAALLVDVPCPKHLDFMENGRTLRESRDRLARVVRDLCGHSGVLACSIGNEISPDIARWYGARRVERFLGDLADAARQVNPDLLLTYGNFPPTEYLELPFLDFQTFNIYLHDRAAFRRYLMRLANQYNDRPLLIGELGMDTFRNGQQAQADLLGGHLREVAMAGLAGAFIFSWTDDWLINGCEIEDWAFGITTRQRAPKEALHAVREVFTRQPVELLDRTPRVSVVVCSYNGGHTLDQCLRSLKQLAYPNYEVIHVDDGSTDDTPEIAARHPSVSTICQKNSGLSAARNAGLAAASGEIIAYTDSDCFVDPDWLTLLVRQMELTGAAAAGGPNLSPDDGRLAACVAAAPGQPTHVLVSDDRAEHVPGCNMAIRREALRAIGGFDPIYRVAGDDVDMCWRLHEAGYRITFSPGAFVWHHRRQTPRAYLKQQAGYGRAEALLARKHPNRFNAFGAGKWRGVLYGNCMSGVRLGRRRVHGGVFGQGLFQTLYRPAAAHWAMLPSTLEWHILLLGLLSAGLTAGVATMWITATVMFALTLMVTILQSAQASPAARHDGIGTRAMIAMLCWLQPLVRSASRYRATFGSLVVPREPADGRPAKSLRIARYITMEGVSRSVLLRRAADELVRGNWQPVLDSGWSPWDIELPCVPGVSLQVRTVQEFYGGNSAQIAIWFRLRRTGLLYVIAGGAAITGLLANWAAHRDANEIAILALAGAAIALASTALTLLRRGRALALRAAAAFDRAARELAMTPFARPKRENRG